jgi:predicted NAD-dependent protein-ADP-ribosyltransferase YbiA (DUF1768 family)
MEYKVCILTSTGEISDTILFSNKSPLGGEVAASIQIHPDDSIRTVKMKILHELHKGKHANEIQLRPSYEELYLYGFAKEETSTLNLFDTVRQSDSTISRNVIEQILEGHPSAKSILKKLPAGDNIPYEDFESRLSEEKIEITVKTPIGIQFAGGYRDSTFEVDPFSVEKHRAYLVEHNNLHYFDDSLLLNHGILIENTIYVCLAGRVYESIDAAAEEYVARYYFPGLYKSGVHSKETLTQHRQKMVKSTVDLLTDERLQYYQSIDTFYEIAFDSSLSIKYIASGIKTVTLRLKNKESRHANLELLFKNMHCSKDIPYIKYNPGNRREKLYRFYFEKTTRTGKRIPYLPRSQIMRMSKETGRGQQISVYLEGAVLNSENRILSNCYVHFETDGSVQLQLQFSVPVNEKMLNKTIDECILPHLVKIGKDIKQTGFSIPRYLSLRDTANTKVINMDFIIKTDATKRVNWESIPCIYSICTTSADKTGDVRLKRVENFKEMDAAHILIAELYGQVQYGDLGLQDIVSELMSRGLADKEETARKIVADFLSTINEVNGEIVEKPGFPMEMLLDSEDKTVEVKVAELTSIFYLDTVGVYVDAILKMTQLYKESNPLLKQLKRVCKKAIKFREVEQKPEDAPTLLNPVNEPLRLSNFAKENDFFAQFEEDDDREEEYAPSEPSKIQYEEEDDSEDLLAKLRKNTKNIKKPFSVEDSSESEEEMEPSSSKKKTPFMISDGEDSDTEEPPVPVIQTPEDTVYNILQFHSKSKLLSSTKEYKPYLNAGMPATAMRDLSNFADFSVEYEGRVYPTVEHAFQSQKYLYATYEDPRPKKGTKFAKETVDDILASFTVDGKMSTLDAKRAGGRVAMEKRGYTLDIVKWTQASIPLMKALILSKIERNPGIRKILEVAKQFHIRLAYFSQSDMKWGCHVAEDGKTITDGKNILGDIYNNWMYSVEMSNSVAPIPVETRNRSPIPVETRNRSPIPPKKVPFMVSYDSEDEEESGGAKLPIDPANFLTENDEEDEPNDQPDSDDKYGLVPDGMPLKSVILKKLQKRDPVIFTSKKESGIYKTFSTSCQPTTRHPVILTQEEFDNTDKSAYQHAVKYGSDPNNQHYFICPRFWCFLTNSAISEKDAKSGKCGKIIPKTAEVVPKGAYVYELNNDENDQYPFPGFMENTRADGKCLPCCFKNWKGKKQTDARARCEAQMNATEDDAEHPPAQPPTKARKQPAKISQYIISLDTYPTPYQRWGFLPIPVQFFLQLDYRPALDPNNPALLKPDNPVMLRYGVEQPLNQSFLGCFADIYAHKQGLAKVPSVDEFRIILKETINLDVFAKAHNGSLLSTFYPKDQQPRTRVSKEERSKYKDTEFALNLDLTDKAKKRHLDDAILAYEHFIAYLTNPTVKIDHQYMWDFVCEDNSRIIPKGANLVIMEIRANDIIDRIELVCPTNLYSRNQFDEAKETVILLKHDDVYEPVYMYESVADGAPNVMRFFAKGRIPSTISDLLKRIEYATRKYCPGLPSLPKIYRFANPVPIQRLLGSLVKIGAKIESQVINYQGKTIGLMVIEKSAKKEDAIYVPCAPSARLQMPIKYMDSLNIPKEYENTVESLNRISTTAKIPCKPVWKIKEEGMIVGFLTETNQFVPITPNEDIIMDGIQTYEGVDVFAADKTVATERKGDRTRIKMTKYITLESQFYHAFRNRVRMLFSKFANNKIKNEIRRIADDKTLLYSQKVERIELLVERLIDGYVIFVDIAKSVLMDMAEVNECDAAEDEGPNCIIKENGVAQLVVPKWNLISKYDNEKIYIGRMADELVRNDRVKSIMYDTVNRLNAHNSDYRIKDDEFILVQSALTPDYFAELDASKDPNPYAKHTNYESANPSISVLYPNEKIPLADQYQPPVKDKDPGKETDQPHECLEKVSGIIGNQRQVWERIFSNVGDAREYIFLDSAHCTFQPIIRVVESKLGEKWSVQNTKTRLSAAYSKLFESDTDNLSKIAKIMREQGKSKMFEKFLKAKADMSPESFQDIVMNDEYYLSDMDIWVIANEYNLPIVVFNANGLKGFFKKIDDIGGASDVNSQWVKMGGDKGDKYYFIRSKIRVAKGSYANHIYKYNLVVPEVDLAQMKEFEDMVVESVKTDRLNTCKLEEALIRFM